MAIKAGEEDQKQALQSLLGGNHFIDDAEKIDQVKSLFKATSAQSAARDLIQHHSDLADIELQSLDISEDQKSRFRELKYWLMHRTY